MARRKQAPGLIANILANLAILALRLLAWLPPASYAPLSWLLARPLRLLARGKCRIAATNLALCFPELSASEHQRLLQLSLRENIHWLFTSARAWCRPQALAREYAASSVVGLEHIQQALDRGQVTVLYQAHQPHMDVALYIFSQHFPICPTYRPYRTRSFNDFMRRSRLQMASAIVSIRAPREVVRQATKLKVLWITSDQDLGAKGAVFAPFLGVNAAHHQGIRRFSQLCKAQACCLTIERRGVYEYQLRIHPPLADFPSDDPVADIRRQNAAIEAALRARPEQYLWFHRRFKTQPDNISSVY